VTTYIAAYCGTVFVVDDTQPFISIACVCRSSTIERRLQLPAKLAPRLRKG
jgi:hypothetical protein